jgi:uncharacterized membrane protein
MNQTKPEYSDRRMENIIGNVLRTGVIIAALVVFIGGIFYLARYGGNLSDYSSFKGEPAGLRHPGTIISNALSFKTRDVIELGLLLLIATPVVRVIFAAFGFLRQRDYVYFCICLVVLAVLTYSIIA